MSFTQQIKTFLPILVILLCFLNKSRTWTSSSEQETILLSTYVKSDWTESVSVRGFAVDSSGNQYQHLLNVPDSAVAKVDPQGNVDWFKVLSLVITNADNILLSNDENSLYMMYNDLSSSSYARITKMNPSNGDVVSSSVVSGYTIFEYFSDIRLSPSEDYLLFTLFGADSAFTIFRMSTGDLSSTELIKITGVGMYARDFLVFPSNKILTITSDPYTATNTLSVLDWDASQKDTEREMACYGTAWGSYTIAAVKIDSHIFAFASASAEEIRLYFMNYTDLSLVGNQMKLAASGASFDRNVKSMEYLNQKIYMTFGKLETSSYGTIIAYDRTTNTFQLFSLMTTDQLLVLALDPRNGDIILGQLTSPGGMFTSKRFPLDYIEMIGDYVEADSSLVFEEATNASVDFGTISGPTSVTKTSLTATISTPTYANSAVNIEKQDVYTINVHPDTKEVTLGLSLVGTTYGIDPITCVDSYSTVSYTYEADGNELDGTTIVTGIDSTSGELTIDTPATEGTYSLAIKATFTGNLTGFIFTPLTINVQASTGGADGESAKGEECFGVSKVACGFSILSIVIGFLALFIVVSIVLYFKYGKARRPKATRDEEEEDKGFPGKVEEENL